MLKIVMGLCSGCGRMWSWHAFLMVCCQTVESLLTQFVRWQVYWVTFFCFGGYAVIMACWKVWSPSASVWFPQVHWSRVCLVMCVPLAFTSLHAAGSELMMLLVVVGPIARASISLGMYSVWGWSFVVGLVVSGFVGGEGLMSLVTFGLLRVSLILSVLARLEVWASRTVRVFGALSSGVWCLSVLLI